MLRLTDLEGYSTSPLFSYRGIVHSPGMSFCCAKRSRTRYKMMSSVVCCLFPWLIADVLPASPSQERSCRTPTASRVNDDEIRLILGPETYLFFDREHDRPHLRLHIIPFRHLSSTRTLTLVIFRFRHFHTCLALFRHIQQYS